MQKWAGGGVVGPSCEPGVAALTLWCIRVTYVTLLQTPLLAHTLSTRCLYRTFFLYFQDGSPHKEKVSLILSPFDPPTK